MTKKYIQNEIFLYLGQEYTLHIGNYTSINLHGSQLLFPQALVFRAQKELTSWYIAQAKEVITKRLEWYAKRENLQYISVTFADTKSRWGACTVDNRMQFNWHLVMAPLEVIDSVVVHELVHTMEKNHTWKFWNKVTVIMPANRQRRKWLNANGGRFGI